MGRRLVPWSEDEIEILRAHYPDEGPFWVGWETLLPDRTDTAIMRKANTLGIRSHATRDGRSVGRKRRGDDERDPMDVMVEQMMAKGMAPSEIDSAMHWYEGTAVRVLAGIWKGSRWD